MKTEKEMSAMFCPLIKDKCQIQKCIACTVVHSPNPVTILHHYLCQNPDCKRIVPKKEKGSFHDEYCIVCGAGRYGEKYGLQPVFEKEKSFADEPLFICSCFDTEEERISRKTRLNNFNNGFKY